MYHRFNENKYPSTNIQMNVFKEQMKIIKNSDYAFSNPKTFAENFNTPKTNKEILITIDDAFLSFYQEAWPYLKENKIPFIFVCFNRAYWEKRVHDLGTNQGKLRLKNLQ